MRSNSRSRSADVVQYSPTLSGSASATCSSDPTPQARVHVLSGAGASTSTRSFTSTAPAAPGGCCPRLRRLLLGGPQALPALGRDGTSDGALTEPRRQVRHAHGRTPSRRCLGCSGEPATAVLGSAIYGPTKATPAASAGRDQDPAVHDPDRRRDQAQGQPQQPASSLGRRADCPLYARCRRLIRQYQQTPPAHEAIVVISQTALSLRRLGPMTKPPPLRSCSAG